MFKIKREKGKNFYNIMDGSFQACDFKWILPLMIIFQGKVVVEYRAQTGSDADVCVFLLVFKVIFRKCAARLFGSTRHLCFKCLFLCMLFSSFSYIFVNIKPVGHD